MILTPTELLTLLVLASIENSGSYTWTSKASLASDNDGKHYFLQICQVGANECTYMYNGRFSFANSQTASTTGASSVTASSAASTSSTPCVQSNSQSSTQTNGELDYDSSHDPSELPDSAPRPSELPNTSRNTVSGRFHELDTHTAQQ